jgi:hypothetical protein
MKELNNLTRMDEAIKGPVPRWQKKCLESSNSSRYEYAEYYPHTSKIFTLYLHIYIFVVFLI